MPVDPGVVLGAGGYRGSTVAGNTARLGGPSAIGELSAFRALVFLEVPILGRATRPDLRIPEPWARPGVMAHRRNRGYYAAAPGKPRRRRRGGEVEYQGIAHRARRQIGRAHV